MPIPGLAPEEEGPPPIVVPDPDQFPAPVTVTPAPSGVYVPEWHCPDGTILHLNPDTGGLGSLSAVGGIGVPPISFVTVDSPDGGVVVTSSRTAQSTIQWPLVIRGQTHAEFLELWRFVVACFFQTQWRRRPGRLRILRPNGAREIQAYYAGGLEVDPSGDGAWLEERPVVSLMCPRGLWRDVDPTSQEWVEAPGRQFLRRYPTVSSSAVFGKTEVRNPGVTDVWPLWRIRGPMTLLTATNLTRGESFQISHTLAAGQEMTISSRPIRVRGPNGENLIDKLNLPGGKPWRVDAGAVSDIEFTVAGAAAATETTEPTRIYIEFYAEHPTP